MGFLAGGRRHVVAVFRRSARLRFGAIDLRLHLVFFALGILGRLLDALFRGLGIGQLHRVEIGCERRLGLRIGGVDQPHDEKERHHRRHEVGIGNLPGAAMVAIMPAAMALDDDDFVLAVMMAFVLAHASTLPTVSAQAAMRVTRMESPNSTERSISSAS